MSTLPDVDTVRALAYNEDPESVWTVFETEVERQNLDEAAFRYAREMDRAISGDQPQSDIVAKRRLLRNELRSYQWCLLGHEAWSPGSRPSSLQMTIQRAGNYAQSYLDNGESEEEVVGMIREDLNEEQRRLPRGIAEWIVNQVGDG